MAVIVAVDAGTTGVRAMAVDHSGSPTATVYREFPQYFPRPGWVEHDADEIWEATAATLAELLAGIDEPVAALGITNQRETVVVWDRRTGRPLHRAVVWQDRRTTGMCRQLREDGHLDLVRARTGLVLDPYFSGTKLSWLFHEGGVTADADTAWGTVDSWLIWRLSGGAHHVTDVTNASRTMLFDITTTRWDPELAELLDVPMATFPTCVPNNGRDLLTAADVVAGLPGGIPIAAAAGDQQAALFGQACFGPGMTKNTYGTGSFVLMNVGERCPAPADGLLNTVAWQLDGGRPVYALEGSVFVTGAAIQWLRDGLGLISDAAEIGPLAESVPDSGGAFFVPALVGMGSPAWDPLARGTMVGLTRGTKRAHLARAVIEAMALQVRDVVDAMVSASGQGLTELRVDGGASVVDLLLAIQADQLGVPVVRATVSDTTALGAAFLAGLAVGVWDSQEQIAGIWSSDATALPAAERAGADLLHAGWSRALERARRWVADDEGVPE